MRHGYNPAPTPSHMRPACIKAAAFEPLSSRFRAAFEPLSSRFRAAFEPLSSRYRELNPALVILSILFVIKLGWFNA